MPHYKAGKIEQLLSFQEILERVEAVQKKLKLESLAFFWLLYYCGVRKSEGYERKIEECQITESLFIVDFGQRKKNGATVDPLELPRSFPGVNLLCEQLLRARQKRASRKQIHFQEETDKPALNKAGKPILRKDGTPKLMKRTAAKTVKARWLFPHVNRSWAARIVKRILGADYYPHFLRLNRLSEIGSDPTANIVRLKSYSGIKSISALEKYLGVSKKEQGAALDFMAKQIKPQEKH